MTARTMDHWTTAEGGYQRELELARDCILGRGPAVDPAWIAGVALRYGRTTARVEADIDALLAETVATI